MYKSSLFYILPYEFEEFLTNQTLPNLKFLLQNRKGDFWNIDDKLVEQSDNWYLFNTVYDDSKHTIGLDRIENIYEVEITNDRDVIGKLKTNITKCKDERLKSLYLKIEIDDYIKTWKEETLPYLHEVNSYCKYVYRICGFEEIESLVTYKEVTPLYYNHFYFTLDINEALMLLDGTRYQEYMVVYDFKNLMSQGLKLLINYEKNIRNLDYTNAEFLHESVLKNTNMENDLMHKFHGLFNPNHAVIDRIVLEQNLVQNILIEFDKLEDKHGYKFLNEYIGKYLQLKQLLEIK
jgi:hypothetical protein